MHPTQTPSLPTIPLDTARAIANSFNEEDLYIKVGNSLETILQGLETTPFQRPLRQTAVPAYVLSLITVFQYREKLTDEDMAEAVRRRPEVRYGLRLSMRYPNVSASNLCQYRRLLFGDTISFEAFEKIAERVADIAQNGASGIQKINLPEAICSNNRIQDLIMSMLEALGILAATNPGLMREIAPAYWYERYSRSSDKFAKEVISKGSPQMILDIGNDIKCLMDLAQQESEIADLAEIKRLKKVFHENFEISQDGPGLNWKPIDCIFCTRTVLHKSEVK